jgi:hypothetical protein
MVTLPSVLRASLDLQTIRAHNVTVTAAGTAGSSVVKSQLNFAERARRFYD